MAGQFPNWTHGSYPPPANTPGYPQQAFTATPAYPAQGTYMPQPHQHPPAYNPGALSRRFIWSAPAHCTGSFEWIPGSNGLVPPNAVPGGMDRDGGPIYVGRAYHQGDLLPAKICPTHGGAFVCHGGQEHSKFQYEVLCSNHVAWKYSSGGSVPPEAIRVGQTEAGEPLYVGRAMIEGTMTIGKVHPSHGCLYIPYSGREISFPDYEVMILN